MSTLQNAIGRISLFQDARLWRIKRHGELMHLCGGIATIILFTILGAIMIWQMTRVFNRSDVKVVQYPRESLRNVLANVTTNYGNPEVKPIMFAFKMNGFMELNIALDESRNLIAVQTCTSAHFGNIETLNQIFNPSRNPISEWICLPLNQQYELGGNTVTNSLKYLEMSFSCTGGANCVGSGSRLELYIFSYKVNPHDDLQGWVSSLDSYIYYPRLNTHRLLWHQLNQNIMTTQASVLPFDETRDTVRGFEYTGNLKQSSYDSLGKMNIDLLFFPSQKEYVYRREYYSLIDAFAYCGGIYNALLVLFLFMNSYGQILMEVFIARVYFYSKQAKNFTFFGYIRQAFYNFTVKINCQPDWELDKKRYSLRQTVKKIMNVIYLQRRVEFLQKGMSVLLEDHQLKGLHMLHRISKEQADENFKKHCLRDRLITQYKQKQKQSQRSSGTNQQLVNGGQTYREERKQNPEGGIQIIIKDNNALRSEAQEQPPDRPSSVEPEELSVDSNNELLEEEALYLELNKSEDFGENLISEEVQVEVERQLKKLLEEATDIRGDERSKKIVERMDRRIINWLRRAQ